MKIDAVKRNLGRDVLVNSPRFEQGTVMRLNAYIVRYADMAAAPYAECRKSKDGYYHSVEVQDMRTDRAVYIVGLEQIEEIDA